MSTTKYTHEQVTEIANKFFLMAAGPVYEAAEREKLQHSRTVSEMLDDKTPILEMGDEAIRALFAEKDRHKAMMGRYRLMLEFENFRRERLISEHRAVLDHAKGPQVTMRAPAAPKGLFKDFSIPEELHVVLSAKAVAARESPSA